MNWIFLSEKEPEIGHANIILTYQKSEGWWLETDTFDDFIAMDIGGVTTAIERLFNQKHE